MTGIQLCNDLEFQDDMWSGNDFALTYPTSVGSSPPRVYDVVIVHGKEDNGIVIVHLQTDMGLKNNNFKKNIQRDC